jgi:hypothetical protein
MLEDIAPAGCMGDFPEGASEFPEEVGRWRPLHRYLGVRHLPGNRLGLLGDGTERIGRSESQNAEHDTLALSIGLVD